MLGFSAKRRFAAILLALLAFAGAPHVGAIELPDAPSDADPAQGVYVKDSAIATDKFNLGQKMEKLREWHKSADIYQEILEKYKDRVVAIGFDSQKNPIKYASVREAVRSSLAKWPREGLIVYCNRFEPAAASMLEQAKRDDAAALHEIYDLYFVTPSGRKAGVLLMNLYLECGEFAGAAQVGQRLLSMHPDLGDDEAMIMLRTAIADHLAGNDEAATRYADELRKSHPDAVGEVAGRDQKLVDVLARCLAQPPAIAASTSPDRYATIGGDASRSALSSATAMPTARVAMIPLPMPAIVGGNEQGRSQVRSQIENQRNGDYSQGATIIPSVDRGQLYFQDGQSIWAVHLESGIPLAGWQQTYPTRSGRFMLAGAAIVAPIANQGLRALPSVEQDTLTLTDDAVVAVMGFPDSRQLMGLPAQRDAGTRLVCLDRATGRLRWTASPDAMPGNAGNARNIAFSGSPLVVGDSVYVIGRGSSAAGVEDCHVICFEMPTGKLRWTCYIASAQDGVAQFGMPVTSTGETLSHLCFGAGKVFVCTNLGAVAAVDAYSGATAWLSLYPRDESVNSRMRQRQVILGGQVFGAGSGPPSQDTPRPWDLNPVIIHEGKVFALPSDGLYLLVYDAATGEEIKRIPRSIELRRGITEQVDMLLGVRDNVLAVATDNTVALIDWTRAQLRPGSRTRLATDSVLFYLNPDTIRGRPFMTRTHLFVASRQNLAVIDIRDPGRARTVHVFPPDPDHWPVSNSHDRECAGNVVVSQDHVVIAGPWNISIYSDLVSARRKYEMAIRRNPSDIDARMTFAEQSFNGREYRQALTLVDEAVGVLGGMQSSSPQRDRIFSDALLFARKLGAGSDADKLELALQLFDRAAAAASTPMQQVIYRKTRAEFCESRASSSGGAAELARAVDLYQQILSDTNLRGVTLTPDDSATSRQAGSIAEDAIQDLIRKHGSTVYAKYNTIAADALAAIGAGAKPEDLMALCEKYPNAAAAPRALLQAAQLYEQHDNPRMATQVLRQLYWKYNSRFTDNAQRLPVLLAMARNYLRSGNVPAALGRLQRAAALSPSLVLDKPLVLPGGKPLSGSDGQPVKTVSEAVSLLVTGAMRQAEELPDSHVPAPITSEQRYQILISKNTVPFPKPFAPESPQSVIPGVQAVLAPPANLVSLTRYDRLLVWMTNRIAALAPGADKPLWTSDAPLDEPVAAAWLDNARVLAWGNTVIALVDGKSGQTRWTVNLTSVQAPEPLSGTIGPEADEADDDDGLADLNLPPNIAIAQRAIIAQQLAVRRGVPIRIVNGRIAPLVQPALIGPAQPAQPQADARPGAAPQERIVSVWPLVDRVIFSTDSGRVLALSLRDGRLLWQTRLANGNAIQQLLANGDFTVARIADGGSVVLSALDSFNGQPIWHRAFSTAQQRFPQNCLLADDGTLVYTTYSSVAAWDLYEPTEPLWERPDKSPRYAGMAVPEQLAVYNQTLLVVCDGGQFIDQFNLRTGKSAGGKLSTSGQDASVQLRLVGPRLYAVGARSFVSYHLGYDTSVKPRVEQDITLAPADMMVSRDYVLIPALLGPTVDDATDFQLLCYSRQLIPSKDGKPYESGLMAYKQDLKEPAQVRSWNLVDGGVYYLAGDDRLHFLKGARSGGDK